MEADMHDSSTPSDTSFERWTQLSDAFKQHLSRMKEGDEEARAEAIRMARELDTLTRLITRELNTGSSNSA
jgi:hypothetical protein